MRRFSWCALAVLNAAVALLLVSPPACGASDIDRYIRKAEQAEQQREAEIRALKRRLEKTHRDKTWYVFRYELYEPKVSKSYIRRVQGHRVQEVVTTTITTQVEVGTLKRHGVESGAETLWQMLHDPMVGRFEYRVFQHEDEADLLLAQYEKSY